MPIIRDDDRPPDSPGEVAAELSHQLARAAVAVTGILTDDRGRPPWSPDAVEAEVVHRLERRLHDFVVVFGTEDVADALLLLAEAIDNLGAGDALDASELAQLWRRLSD